MLILNVPTIKIIIDIQKAFEKSEIHLLLLVLAIKIRFFNFDHKVITWSGGLEPNASYN